VHISSTGVYAEDCGGEVDEDSPVGESPRQRALLEAEEDLLLADSAGRVRATVLRCSGLVGPRRGPHRWIDRLAGATRRDGWLNLVRIDDVVSVVERAFSSGITGRFNVSAGAVSRREFYAPLLERAGLEPVQWQEGTTGRGARVVADRAEAAFDLRFRPVDSGDLGEG
jgi:nucleoside-diphosphate-sugar epimerase